MIQEDSPQENPPQFFSLQFSVFIVYSREKAFGPRKHLQGMPICSALQIQRCGVYGLLHSIPYQNLPLYESIIARSKSPSVRSPV